MKLVHFGCSIHNLRNYIDILVQEISIIKTKPNFAMTGIFKLMFGPLRRVCRLSPLALASPMALADPEGVIWHLLC